MEVRVKDAGESEGQFVMSWIGVQALPPRKRADFQQVSHYEKVWQTVESGKADDGNSTFCAVLLAGASTPVSVIGDGSICLS